MKKIIYIIALVALTLGSCDRIDFGDINIDPSVPVTGNTDALLRGAMSSFATNGFRTYYSNATLYAQYQSQTVYTQEQLYSQFVGSWFRYYTEQLNNLKEVANTNEDVRGATDNMKAIAELTSVLITKRITDTFGDIPYFDALNGTDDVTPNYDPQRDIYLDLIERAKAARDLLNPNAFTPDADTDIYYGGDINKWGKFANSLILALSIQLSNTDASTLAEAAFNEALNNVYGVIEDNADNMVFTPDVAGGVINPISRSRASDYSVTKELTDALKGNAEWDSDINGPKNPTSNKHFDHRVDVYTMGQDGLPYGYQGYDNYAGTAANMNDIFDQQDSPFTLFSAAYTWLNRAEGAVIYNTGEVAEDMLTKGIETSYAAYYDFFASYNVPQSQVDAWAQQHATDRIADANDPAIAPGGLLQVIGEEKWFALFPDGYAAWAEQRRTGFPALHPAPDAVNGGVIPHRMLYPDNSKNVNPNGWAQGVQGLLPAEDLNTSKIWWEQ